MYIYKTHIHDVKKVVHALFILKTSMNVGPDPYRKGSIANVTDFSFFSLFSPQLA